MVAIKTGRGAKTLSKSAFVREKLSAGMKPLDIVAAAKAAGMPLSSALVYIVRSREKPGKRGRKRATAGGSSRGKGGRDTKVRAATSGASEAIFRRMAFDLGLGRARLVIDELEIKLRQLLTGT